MGLNECTHRGYEPRREARSMGRVTSFIIPKCKVLKALAITWRERGKQEAKSHLVITQPGEKEKLQGQV